MNADKERDEFEEWFKSYYIQKGFAYNKEEMRESWQEAKQSAQKEIDELRFKVNSLEAYIEESEQSELIMMDEEQAKNILGLLNNEHLIDYEAVYEISEGSIQIDGYLTIEELKAIVFLMGKGKA